MEFALGTRVVSGENGLETLKSFHARKVLVVCDPFFYENGQAARVAAFACGEQTEFFYEVTPDPSVELAAKGTGFLKAFDPELVIALGGGSAMDLAKAMCYFAGAGAALCAVPTTSGSGSEVTDFAILTHNGVKHPLVDPRLRPHTAILEGSLLESLPESLIADGGFDAISHALEALVATNAGAITDCLAVEAFKRLLAMLPASYGGDKSVRLRLHEASTMAGMAFSQAGLGLCHALAHALGGKYHIPHGRLNAILLPAVVSVNAHSAMEKYAKIARAAGLGGSADALAVRNLKNALVRLRRELHLPATLQQAGIQPAQVYAKTDQIVDAALADPCCKTNPTGVEDYMVRSVLEEVTGRG